MRIAAIILLAMLVVGCGPDKVKPFRPTDMDLTPTSQPATAAEATDLRIKLNKANAAIAAAENDAQAAREAAKSANDKTWSFFRSVAYSVGGVGLLVVIASMLPWTAFLAPFRQAGFLLLGAGVCFGAMPFILANYAWWAVIPVFAAVGLYVLGLAFLDLRTRWKKSMAEATMAVKVLDPGQKETATDLIEAKAAHSPMFAAALDKAKAMLPPAP